MADTFHLGYVDAVVALERAYRTFMRTLNQELDRSEYDVNATQAMIVYHLNDREIRYSHLTHQCQAGTNAHYNVERLTKVKLIERRRDPGDKRINYIRCTSQGLDLRGFVDRIIKAQGEVVQRMTPVDSRTLVTIISGLRDIERLLENIVR